MLNCLYIKITYFCVKCILKLPFTNNIPNKNSMRSCILIFAWFIHNLSQLLKVYLVLTNILDYLYNSMTFYYLHPMDYDIICFFYPYNSHNYSNYVISYCIFNRFTYKSRTSSLELNSYIEKCQDHIAQNILTWFHRQSLALIMNANKQNNNNNSFPIT